LPVKFLLLGHILVMFTAVSFSVGGGLVMGRIIRTADVPTIRRALAAASPVLRWIGALFGLGALLGLAAAFAGQFNVLAPWLIASYVLFVLAGYIGGNVVGAWMRRVGMAAGQSPLEEPSPDLRAAIDDPRGRWGEWATWAILAVFIVLMVFKPGA
jgi:hypothetical protein